MRIALKIDVDTLQGTLHGVPSLAAACQRHGAQATFLFSLGPDHTGRAIKRVFRPGFLTKVSRTSVLEHYGLRTLLYGTLLPGPDIGRRCAAQLRGIADQGFEVGVHCWDHASWQDDLAGSPPAFAERQMRRAVERFTEIFGRAPQVHGAAGWQMNDAALRCLDELGFRVASNTRGGAPFRPRVDGRALRCVELPTTLPTLDELMGREDEPAPAPSAFGGAEPGVATPGVAVPGTGPVGPDPVAYLLRQTAVPSGDHVYTLHAELEGRRLAPWFERLLAGWRSQGYEFVSLGELAAGLDPETLPVRSSGLGTVPGRSGTLAVALQD